MSKITVPVVVSKSGYDLGGALVDLVKAMKDATSNGWQPLSDIPAIVAAGMKDVMIAASSIPNVAGDAVEDKVAFVQGLELRLSEIVRLFV